MKHFDVPQINTPEYWDTHQTALDFGLRQKKYLELAGRGTTIAEIGCGLSPMLAHADNFRYKIGIDFSVETVKQANKLYPDVMYFVDDATKMMFNDGLFDVTVCGEVIEHVDNPEALVKELMRVTKKKVIISTPNLEFDDPEHLWELGEGDLYDLLIDYGKVETDTIESERFPGRKYIFAVCDRT